MIGAIAGAVAGLAGSVIGGINSARSMKKANRLIQQQRDENKAWYNTKMSQDYTERADVQSAINKQRELLNQQYSQARATNVVAGGTDQALAMQQKAANGSLSDTMSGIAENAAAYKDNVEAQYRQQDAALNQQQVQNYQQKAAAAAQAGSQAASAGIGLMGNLVSLGKTKAAGGVAGSAAQQQGVLSAPVNTDLSPNSIPGPGASVLGLDKLPKIRS